VRSSRRHRLTLVVAAFAALLSVFGLSGVASAAEPDDPDGVAPPNVQQALEALSRAYYDAQVALDSSQKRQSEIKQSLDVARAQLDQLSVQIGGVAAARFKGSAVGLFNGMMEGAIARDDLFGGAAVADYLLWRDDSYIHNYRVIKDQAESQQALLDAEVAIEVHTRDMLEQQKLDAERALAAAGGMVSTSGYTGGPMVPAQPAPRNADGSLPYDPQSITDPTPASGKITFRTYHMLQEARNAGFTRYVSCYRSGGPYEHPKGRACDFSATPYGFANSDASGDDKEYGSQLAAWAVRNANALAIMYVIWYRQIWTPRQGWHRYGGAGGDPASDHTNHVHISML
jgi:hypothetical protein